MPRLTKRNYLSPTNKHISNSKIGDWLKDKHYFYRKNWIGDVTREITDSLIMGSAVDCWIMNGEKVFRDEYMLVSRRSRKEDGYEFQLNQTMYNSVEKMARNIIMQDAYKKLRGFTSQKILQVDDPIGIFPGLCGMIDWFKIYDKEKPKRAVIVDLKTAKDASPDKYFYHCRDFGYYRQLAFYYMLINHHYGVEFKDFTFRHLVVEKDGLDINNVYAFEFEPRIILDALAELKEILADIAKETKFKPHDAKWEDAIKI